MIKTTRTVREIFSNSYYSPYLSTRYNKAAMLIAPSFISPYANCLKYIGYCMMHIEITLVVGLSPATGVLNCALKGSMSAPSPPSVNVLPPYGSNKCFHAFNLAQLSGFTVNPKPRE